MRYIAKHCAPLFLIFLFFPIGHAQTQYPVSNLEILGEQDGQQIWRLWTVVNAGPAKAQGKRTGKKEPLPPCEADPPSEWEVTALSFAIGVAVPDIKLPGNLAVQLGESGTTVAKYYAGKILGIAEDKLAGKIAPSVDQFIFPQTVANCAFVHPPWESSALQLVSRPSFFARKDDRHDWQQCDERNECPIKDAGWEFNWLGTHLSKKYFGYFSTENQARIGSDAMLCAFLGETCNTAVFHNWSKEARQGLMVVEFKIDTPYKLLPDHIAAQSP